MLKAFRVVVLSDKLNANVSIKYFRLLLTKNYLKVVFMYL